MKQTKTYAIFLSAMLAMPVAFSNTWNPNVPVGARWGDAANWSAGVPGTGDTAIFSQTQANTLNVDVDMAATTRLQQVSQPHTFSGSGSIFISANPTTQFQNIIYNTVSGGTVTYGVPVSLDTQASANYGQMNNSGGGTTIFNHSFTLTSDSLLNVIGGTYRFRGDLTATGFLRLDCTVVIEGSGTTAIASYLGTSGVGSKLYLNRTGAYSVVGSGGYLRIERTDVHLGADYAVGIGTDVRLHGDLGGDLIADGDYAQNFGTLRNAQSTPADLDLGNSSSAWTFADSSAEIWSGGFNISNVDTNKTVIRFAVGSGGGLTATQISQITLNGSALTPADTTLKDGYLYITPNTAIRISGTISLLGLSPN